MAPNGLRLFGFSRDEAMPGFSSTTPRDGVSPRPGQRDRASAPATRTTVLLSIANPMPGAGPAPMRGQAAS